MGSALAGQVAIVTGASRGIGKGCALELAAAGATVYLTGRTVREGEAALPGTVGATAAEIAAAGGGRPRWRAITATTPRSSCSSASIASRASSTCSSTTRS